MAVKHLFVQQSHQLFQLSALSKKLFCVCSICTYNLINSVYHPQVTPVGHGLTSELQSGRQCGQRGSAGRAGGGWTRGWASRSLIFDFDYSPISSFCQSTQFPTVYCRCTKTLPDMDDLFIIFYLYTCAIWLVIGLYCSRSMYMNVAHIFLCFPLLFKL